MLAKVFWGQDHMEQHQNDNDYCEQMIQAQELSEDEAIRQNVILRVALQKLLHEYKIEGQAAAFVADTLKEVAKDWGVVWMAHKVDYSYIPKKEYVPEEDPNSEEYQAKRRDGKKKRRNKKNVLYASAKCR